MASKNEVSKLQKEIKKVKQNMQALTPEKKYFDVEIHRNMSTVGNRYALCDPSQGINTTHRIGNDIKATSYYGVFFVRCALNATLTNAIRMVHYWEENENVTSLTKNDGTPLSWNDLQNDYSVEIIEDKLVPIAPDTGGTCIRKVIFKGKYKYPRKIKFSNEFAGTSVNKTPYLWVVGDQTSGSEFAIMDGTFRYYYTDV